MKIFKKVSEAIKYFKEVKPNATKKELATFKEQQIARVNDEVIVVDEYGILKD